MTTRLGVRSGPTDGVTGGDAARVSTDDVWRELSKSSFAVLAHVTGAGEPRTSGVVYGTAARHMFVAVARDGWKGRQIADGQIVGLTVPLRRGGLLSLLVPIPPATVSFRARVVVHPSGTLDLRSISKQLSSLVPDDRRDATILELIPEGAFLTYGLGVSLMDMAKPAVAQSRVPVS